MVPHGQSVVATAPAVFRFTYPACAERHDTAARLLTVDATLAAGPEALPDAIVALCRDVGIPNGLTAFGYEAADVPGLVAGAARQQRILAISPRPVSEDDLAAIFRNSLTNW
jgi:hydroxyacid-oxoacid transhydrogenase